MTTVEEDSWVQVIVSRQNPVIKRVRKLQQPKHRLQEGRCLLEGPRLVKAALEAGVKVEQAFFLEPAGSVYQAAEDLLARLARSGAELFPVRESVLEALATTDSPQGLVAVARQESGIGSASMPLDLAVDGLQDPGNLGTLLRSAAAVGCGEALLGPETADPYNPKVLRAAMGAAFWLHLVPVADLVPELRQRQQQGRALAVAAPRAPALWGLALPLPAVLVVGNEARGIRPEIRSLADLEVGIPLEEVVESLNAAVAGSLCLFEWKRRRFCGSGRPGP